MPANIARDQQVFVVVVVVLQFLRLDNSTCPDTILIAAGAMAICTARGARYGNEASAPGAPELGGRGTNSFLVTQVCLIMMDWISVTFMTAVLLIF